MKPILFNTPMVQAILEGRKTQTRREIKPKPRQLFEGPFGGNAGFVPGDFAFATKHSSTTIISCKKNGPDNYAKEMAKYQVGDILDPCISLSDRYCISYNGNVYSRKRGEWKEIKGTPTSKGYLAVSLIIDGKKKTRPIHRLVCSAFNGKPEKESHQVRHLDGNQHNNVAGNLKWGSQSENWADRKAHGNGIEGEKHWGVNFNDEERKHIKWAIDKGLCSQRHAARVLGVAQQNIWQICHPERLIIPSEEITEPAARIFLEITNVRVERLQDISEEDAIAEGIKPMERYITGGEQYPQMYENYLPVGYTELPPKDSFQTLWQSINGNWDENPWVFVFDFKRTSQPK